MADDDPSIRAILAAVLQEAGFWVRCAADGAAAWEALCEEGFNLLISDYEMPRLTGLDLLRRVRACQTQLPVILISGRLPKYEGALPGLLKPGCTLDKPFAVADLLTKVNMMVVPGSPAVTHTVRGTVDGLHWGVSV